MALKNRAGDEKGPKGPEGDKLSAQKFHSEAEIQGAKLSLARCGPVLSRFGFSTWRVREGPKGDKCVRKKFHSEAENEKPCATCPTARLIY